MFAILVIFAIFEFSFIIGENVKRESHPDEPPRLGVPSRPVIPNGPLTTGAFAGPDVLAGSKIGSFSFRISSAIAFKSHCITLKKLALSCRRLASSSAQGFRRQSKRGGFQSDSKYTKTRPEVEHSALTRLGARFAEDCRVRRRTNVEVRVTPSIYAPQYLHALKVLYSTGSTDMSQWTSYVDRARSSLFDISEGNLARMVLYLTQCPARVFEGRRSNFLMVLDSHLTLSIDSLSWDDRFLCLSAMYKLWEKLNRESMGIGAFTPSAQAMTFFEEVLKRSSTVDPTDPTDRPRLKRIATLWSVIPSLVDRNLVSSELAVRAGLRALEQYLESPEKSTTPTALKGQRGSSFESEVDSWCGLLRGVSRTIEIMSRLGSGSSVSDLLACPGALVDRLLDKMDSRSKNSLELLSELTKVSSELTKVSLLTGGESRVASAGMSRLASGKTSRVISGFGQNLTGAILSHKCDGISKPVTGNKRGENTQPSSLRHLYALMDNVASGTSKLSTAYILLDRLAKEYAPEVLGDSSEFVRFTTRLLSSWGSASDRFKHKTISPDPIRGRSDSEKRRLPPAWIAIDCVKRSLNQCGEVSMSLGIDLFYRLTRIGILSDRYGENDGIEDTRDQGNELEPEEGREAIGAVDTGRRKFQHPFSMTTLTSKILKKESSESMSPESASKLIVGLAKFNLGPDVLEKALKSEPKVDRSNCVPLLHSLTKLLSVDRSVDKSKSDNMPLFTEQHSSSDNICSLVKPVVSACAQIVRENRHNLSLVEVSNFIRSVVLLSRMNDPSYQHVIPFAIDLGVSFLSNSQFTKGSTSPRSTVKSNMGGLDTYILLDTTKLMLSSMTSDDAGSAQDRMAWLYRLIVGTVGASPDLRLKFRSSSGLVLTQQPSIVS